MAWWGNAGYRLVDLDHDGRPEFRSGDDRFAYAFTAFAASAWPVRIWHFDHGRMRDVTRAFALREGAAAAVPRGSRRARRLGRGRADARPRRRGVGVRRPGVPARRPR